MSCSINPSSINQTFIIEPLSLTGGAPTISACTSLYTNNLISCSGDTQIFMGTGIITFDGSIYTNQDLSASTINASTYFSGGTNLIDIINSIQITGGTFNNVTDTLTLEQTNGYQINVTGFTDYYTTGSTLIGDTIYFDRTDLLSAYTVNLSSLNVDTYVTGVTFNDNQLIITRNDGVSLNTFINSFTGLTINGSLSATTYYGDGSNLTGIPNTFTTGATYSNGFVYFDRNDILSAYTLNLSVLTGDTNTFVTGGTVSGNTLELFRNDGVQIDIDLSEINFSGGSGNCITNLYVTNVHGCSPITFHDTLRILNGLTVTGSSIFDDISATTISATTYLNLPIDVFVTGATYSNGTTVFTNNTGGTFSVSGFSTGSNFTGGTVSGATNFTGGLTADTMSATTYLGLPMDVYSTGLTINNATYDLQITRNDGVILTANLGTLASDVNITGGTYNNNTGVVTFVNNTGGTFNVSGFTTGMTDTTVTSFSYDNENKFTIGDSTGGTFTATINTVTGLTVNGSLSATTYLGLPLSISADTYWISGSSGTNSIKANNNTAIVATGNYAVAEGGNTKATGTTAHAEGSGTTAGGNYSHAEGINTSAIGSQSHAEGSGTQATGTTSHAEGTNTKAWGTNSHAEGSNTTASGNNSHAEGTNTLATGSTAHAEGSGTRALGSNSHAEGGGTSAAGANAHSEGNLTFSSGISSHAEGTRTTATGDASHAEGTNTTVSGTSAHAEGSGTTAFGNYSHSEGSGTTAFGSSSHAEGGNTQATGTTSHAEGQATRAWGAQSHAEGNGTTAFGIHSHAEGSATKALGAQSHAEGLGNTASGQGSHAEGSANIAGGISTHAEGDSNTALGDVSHIEGTLNTSTGFASFTGGENNKNNSNHSLVHGSGNTLNNSGSFILSLNSTLNGNRSAIIGGRALTGTTDDTVYVPKLNINITSGGTQVYSLGLDSNGFVITGITPTDIFLTGGTPNDSAKIYTFTNNTGGTFNVTALTDLRITGGTYNAGTAVFTNNTGGTFSISGFSTGSTIPLNQITYGSGTGITSSNIFTITPSATSVSIGSLVNPFGNTSANLNITSSASSTYVGTNIYNAASNGAVSNFFTESSTRVALFARFNSGYVGNIFAIPYANAFFIDNVTNGSDGTGPVLIQSSKLYSLNGTLSTNMGFANDAVGFKIAPNNQLVNPNTVAFEVATGTTKLGGLSGSGTRMVVADSSGILSTQIITDTFVTGGTYSNGTTVFTNNTGGTFSVTGFSTGSTVTLQQAYNVSSSPEIVTNSTLGGLSILDGVGSGTTVFNVTSTGSTNLFNVVGDGTSVFGSNITIDGEDVTNYPISIRSSRNDLTRMQLINQGATQTDLEISINGGANSIYYGVSAAGNSFIDNRTGNLLFQNTGVSQMTFDTTGNLGIGENTPSSTLHVKGSGATSSGYALKVDDSTSNPLLYVRNDGKVGVGNLATGSTFSVSSNNADIFRTSAVGTYNTSVIESDNYSSSLNINSAVNGPIGGYSSGVYLNANGINRGSFNSESTTSVTTLEAAGGYWLLLKNSTTESIGLGQGGNYIQFNTNGTSKMLIDGPTGNVAIGNPIFVPTAKLHVSGNTLINGTLTVDTISATTYLNLPTDVFVTGGTYNAGTAVFTNNTGGTFSVSGFSTGGSGGGDSITGGTYNNATGTLSLNSTASTITITGFTTGSTSSVFTGGTVSGATQFTGGLTANTISATTYLNLPINRGSFGLTVDGSGSVITSGIKGYLVMPYNATITGWDVIGNVSGDCMIDIWKNTSIPTSADTITGTEAPNLSNQQINSDNNLTNFNTGLFINDILAFNVISASTVSRINVIIKVIKT